MDPEDPEDREVSAECGLCGARISLASGRAFEFGAENVLCFDCALERGGRYDEARDVWEVSPDLSGLGDEAYGSSPHEIRRGRR